MIWFVTEISKVQTQPQNAPQPPTTAFTPSELTTDGSIPATNPSSSSTEGAEGKPEDLLLGSSAKTTARQDRGTQPQKRTI
ncbi:hypothetical protein QFC24_000831 [Naganishia onofrii]|uniref:Uncharacterized protein n=1 Tax=Naganishia onofrii TaxID=1851511 RepID=A0ACC2XU67_9TREE|nr:hypothetical protein QFC24_000831 [Naganishia onofrii]